MGRLDLALVAYREDQWENQGKFLMKDEVLLVANRDSPVMEFVREGQGGYRSRAIRAFENAMYQVLASEVF